MYIYYITFNIIQILLIFYVLHENKLQIPKCEANFEIFTQMLKLQVTYSYIKL